MFILQSNSFNPFFNLATEEYLFKQATNNYFLLYRNNPSIIIGKHQNAFSEINYKQTINSTIPVIRRLSGGGTVYHDRGNINFSFIVNKEGKNLIDFKKHIEPFYNLLIELGVNVSYSKRNDLFIGDKKISGNAEHVFKNRILHHGTLLYNTELHLLRNALKLNPDKFKSKAINSIRSPVDNIINHLNNPLLIDKFCELLISRIENENQSSEPFILNNNDIKNIENLVENKYKTWEWNYSYSPDFEFTKSIEVDGYTFSAKLVVKKGIISEINLSGNNLAISNLKLLEKTLKNVKYSYESVLEKINYFKNQRNINFDLIDAFFD